MRTIRLWVREDGEAPKAIALDAVRGPGPGRVFDVRAKTATDARQVLERFFRPEPDRRADRAGWIEWDEARERVSEVTS